MNIEKLLVIPQQENIDEFLEISRKYDCGFEYNDFFSPNLLDDADRLEERIYYYKMKEHMPKYTTLHGAFLDVSIFSDDSRIKAVSDFRVEESIGIARQLGAKAVIFHTNYIDNFRLESYRESWLARNEAYWKDKLEKYPDICIYIENMFDSDCELLMRLGKAMKDVPNFGICFDYAHAHVFGDEKKIEEWVVGLAPYVKHLHLNDNDFVTDLHQSLGTGQIDWNKFKEYYEKYFNKASVLLEVTGIEKTKESLDFLATL